MILTITNTDLDSDYDANGVQIPAGQTMGVDDSHIHSFGFDGHNSNRLNYLNMTSSTFFPFGQSSNGDVPEFNLNGNAQEKLFVALVDDIASIRQSDSVTINNRGD